MNLLLFMALGMLALWLSWAAFGAVARSALRWKDNGRSSDGYSTDQFVLAHVAIALALATAGGAGYVLGHP